MASAESILENLSASVLALDRDGCIDYANPAAERTLGWALGELAGKGVHETLCCGLTCSEQGPSGQCPLLVAARSGEECSGEVLFAREDGATFPAGYTSTPLAEGGRTSGAVVTFRDVTTRVRAEEVLRESEQRLRLLTEQVPAVLWTTDPDLRFTSALGSGMADMPLRAEQYAGMSLYELFGVADPDFPPIAAHRRALQGESTRYEMERYGRVFETHLEPFLDAQQHIVGVVGMALDVTERVRSEEALRESEVKFRAVYESNVLPIWFWTADGRVTEANDAYLDLTDFTRAELEAGELRWDALTPPELLHLDRRALEEVSARGAYEPYEKEYVLRDRRRVPVLIGGGLLPGYADRGVGFAINLTERKHLEGELRRSEERFRSLVQNLSDVIVVVDREGTILYQSPSIERVLGYLPESRVGKKLLELSTVHPEDLPRVRDSLNAAKAAPKAVIPVQLRVRHADGTWRHIEGEGTNLLDDPVVGGIVLSYRDVTARVCAEERLRESEERFRLLVQNSSDIIAVSSAGGILRYVSPSVERVLGYRPEDLEGTNGSSLAHSGDLERARQVYAATLTKPGGSASMELRFRHRDGSWRHLEVLGRNLLGDPTIRGLVFNARDVTDRKELAIAGEHARLAREMHDGLAQVLGYVNVKAQAAERLLARGESTEASSEIGQLVDVAREAYAGLREDILGLRASPELERGLLGALGAYVEQWQSRSGVDVELVAPENFRPRLSPTAELQLLRIVQEALSNVRKHSGALHARVVFAEAGGRVKVTVEDDGRGFDPLRSGSGEFPRFGLKMMRERANAAGGSLEVRSSRSQGTRVVVRLPVDGGGGPASPAG